MTDRNTSNTPESSVLVGYWGNWVFEPNPEATNANLFNYFTDALWNCVRPYTHVNYMCLLLYGTDNKCGIPPPPQVEWNNSLNYAPYVPFCKDGKILTKCYECPIKDIEKDDDGITKTGFTCNTPGSCNNYLPLKIISKLCERDGKIFSITIGGWSDIQSTPFFHTDIGDAKAKMLVNNILALKEVVGFQGVDFDWEHLSQFYYTPYGDGKIPDSCGPLSASNPYPNWSQWKYFQDNPDKKVQPTYIESISRCMFLGRVMKLLKDADPSMVITYTTRPNFLINITDAKPISGLQIINSLGSITNSDGEGIGVFAGIIYDGSDRVEDRFTYVGNFADERQTMRMDRQKFINSFPFTKADLSTIFKIINFVNFMSYDVIANDYAFGLPENNYFKTEDLVKFIQANKLVIPDYMYTINMGFEPSWQAQDNSSGSWKWSQTTDENKFNNVKDLDSAWKADLKSLYDQIKKESLGFMFWQANESRNQKNRYGINFSDIKYLKGDYTNFLSSNSPINKASVCYLFASWINQIEGRILKFSPFTKSWVCVLDKTVNPPKNKCVIWGCTDNNEKVSGSQSNWRSIWYPTEDDNGTLFNDMSTKLMLGDNLDDKNEEPNTCKDESGCKICKWYSVGADCKNPSCSGTFQNLENYDNKKINVKNPKPVFGILAWVFLSLSLLGLILVVVFRKKPFFTRHKYVVYIILFLCLGLLITSLIFFMKKKEYESVSNNDTINTYVCSSDGSCQLVPGGGCTLGTPGCYDNSECKDVNGKSQCGQIEAKSFYCNNEEKCVEVLKKNCNDSTRCADTYEACKILCSKPVQDTYYYCSDDGKCSTKDTCSDDSCSSDPNFCNRCGYFECQGEQCTKVDICQNGEKCYTNDNTCENTCSAQPISDTFVCSRKNFPNLNVKTFDKECTKQTCNPNTDKNCYKDKTCNEDCNKYYHCDWKTNSCTLIDGSCNTADLNCFDESSCLTADGINACEQPKYTCTENGCIKDMANGTNDGCKECYVYYKYEDNLKTCIPVWSKSSTPATGQYKTLDLCLDAINCDLNFVKVKDPRGHNVCVPCDS